MEFGAYVYLAVLVIGAVTILAYLGENRFKAFETFVGLGPSVAPKEVPSESEEEYQGAPLKTITNEKLIASDRLIPMGSDEAEMAWGKLTSEKCYRSDMAVPLQKTGNFLQRTNNYPRTHPDSCSAPNHEMIGTFYRPHEGVGATPASGLPYPRGAIEHVC